MRHCAGERTAIHGRIVKPAAEAEEYPIHGDAHRSAACAVRPAAATAAPHPKGSGRQEVSASRFT